MGQRRREGEGGQLLGCRAGDEDAQKLGRCCVPGLPDRCVCSRGCREKVALALQGLVTVAAVDADAEKSAAAEYGVKGFPTIKLLVGRGDGQAPRALEYKGQRTAPDIARWALAQASKLVEKRLGASGGDDASAGNRAGGRSQQGSAGASNGFYKGTGALSMHVANMAVLDGPHRGLVWEHGVAGPSQTGVPGLPGVTGVSGLEYSLGMERGKEWGPMFRAHAPLTLGPTCERQWKAAPTQHQHTPSEPADVLELDDSNFHATLSESDNPMFVEFYAPWVRGSGCWGLESVADAGRKTRGFRSPGPAARAAARRLLCDTKPRRVLGPERPFALGPCRTKSLRCLDLGAVISGAA